MMSGDYEREQAELKAKNAMLNEEILVFEEQSAKADNFMELVRRYTEFDELSTELLYEFVDKVCVHESDRSSCERRQRVDIHLSFIGDFKITMPEPTQEEIEAEKKRMAQKLKNQQNCQNYRARKKAKRQREQEKIA
jgi:hypothetical protein